MIADRSRGHEDIRGDGFAALGVIMHLSDAWRCATTWLYGFMLVGLVPLEMRCEVATLHRFFPEFLGRLGLKSDRMFSHFWLDIRCCAYISHNMRSSGGP